MKYDVKLTSVASDSLTHELSIDIDLNESFNICLIVGNSGSGKTTLAKRIFGDDCFINYLNFEKALIDQFPDDFLYEDISYILHSVGLSQVPCWLMPASNLSNGQKFRAEIALQIANNKNDDKIIIIDEFSSVVDRTVGKIISHVVQKYARKNNKKIVILSCHYDIIEWLNPDILVDCNKKISVRRVLQQRTEQFRFDIRECSRNSWHLFSKYHYLTDRLTVGKGYFYGLFYNNVQIGFLSFGYYIPGRMDIVHITRTVIHPDYVGINLSLLFKNKVIRHLLNNNKNIKKVYTKFSNISNYYLYKKDKKNWKYLATDTNTKTSCNDLIARNKQKTLRQHVRYFRFQWVGDIQDDESN